VNKKGISTLVIVAIIVIAVVIAGIAVYVLYSGGGTTPTSPVEGATSMRFDVEATVNGAVETDRFTVKNLGTSDVLLRVDQTDKDGNNFTYLMNQTGQTVWADFGTGFIDYSSDFTTYWDNNLIGNAAVDKYMTALANWSGTGNYEGDSYVISNIVVNPTLPDSAFQPT
jgi:outer membrane lipoprotein-sorting protein